MENVLVHFRRWKMYLYISAIISRRVALLESLFGNVLFHFVVGRCTCTFYISVVVIGTKEFNLRRDFLTVTYYLNLNLEISQEAVLHKWNLT